MSNKTGKKRKREDEDYIPNFDEVESEEEYNPDGIYAEGPKEPPMKKLKLMTIFAPVSKTITTDAFSTTTSTITTPSGTFTPIDDVNSIDLSSYSSSIAVVNKSKKKKKPKFPFKKEDRAGGSGRTRSFRQLISEESKRIGNAMDPTYTSIEASLSTLPKRKYCDITGLEGKYVDPNTKLRYHSQKVYKLISDFKNDRLKDQFINLRNGKGIK